MINKSLRGLFFFLTGLSVIFLLQGVNSTPVLLSPSNFTNLSGTMTVNCSAPSINLPMNVTLWYNSSGGNTANTTLAIGAATTALVNTSENQTWFFNTSVIISGLTDGTTYSFWCEFINRTNTHVNSTFNGSITIDNIAPVVKIHNATGSIYQNASTFKNANTSTLTLNVSVSDATTSVSYGYGNCIFEINGTNETIAISNSWCNTTKLNLTGLAEGNQTIEVWVNDSAGNWKINNSFVVWIDTINPSPTATCSDVYAGNAFPCSCSASDSGTGVSSTSGASNSADGTSTPTLTGQFTYACGATDRTGNTASTTCTYLVQGTSSNTGGSSGGGGSGVAGFWSKGTFAVSQSQFQNGYTKTLSSKQRIRVRIQEEDHHIGVRAVSSNTATIEISSEPQNATLVVGDERKFDVTGDGYYDVLVTLNNIIDGYADLTIKSISEEITEETKEQEQEKEAAATGEEEPGEEKETSNTLWIIIIIVLVLVIGAAVATKKKKK